MATFNTESPQVRDLVSDSLSAPVTEELLEAATQTFLAGDPVTINGAGFVAEFTEGNTDLYGIATKDGGNGASAGDKTSRVVALDPRGRVIVCTLLENSAANHTYAQTDVGAEVSLALDGSNWHAQIGGSGFQVVSVVGDHMATGRTKRTPTVGDINVRVAIRPHDATMMTNT
jgi:hypothetical protein